MERRMQEIAKTEIAEYLHNGESSGNEVLHDVKLK